MLLSCSLLKTLANRLAKPDILFWILPLMMGLLVLGTIAQKNIGLYAAQEQYFGSFFVMAWNIPLPAGLTIMGIFFINLTCKFLFKSDWSWQKTGTILSHFGVLILVFGGLLSSLTSREGFLVIQQGEQASFVEDYHERTIAIRKNGVLLQTIAHDTISDGTIITDPAMPFSLTIDKYCFNCTITRRPESEQDGWHAPANAMMLNKAPADPQDENNMTGIEFSVNGTTTHDGKYLTFDGFPKPPTLLINSDKFTITMERAKRELPFSLSLDKFERSLHPGTDMASAFTSQITIHDPENAVTFPATIEMNEPLRYQGLTFYQSSFDLSGEKPYTVLAVVENKGRIFPYLASFVIALGLIIHLTIRLFRSKRKG